MTIHHLARRVRSLWPGVLQTSQRLTTVSWRCGKPPWYRVATPDGLRYNQARSLTLSATQRKRSDDPGGRHTRHIENHEDEGEGEDGDLIDDAEVDELFHQQVPKVIGDGEHRIFIVHPDVKWGSRKQYLTTGDCDTRLRNIT